MRSFGVKSARRVSSPVSPPSPADNTSPPPADTSPPPPADSPSPPQADIPSLPPADEVLTYEIFKRMSLREFEDKKRERRCPPADSSKFADSSKQSSPAVPFREWQQRFFQLQREFEESQGPAYGVDHPDQPWNTFDRMWHDRENQPAAIKFCTENRPYAVGYTDIHPYLPSPREHLYLLHPLDDAPSVTYRKARVRTFRRHVDCPPPLGFRLHPMHEARFAYATKIATHPLVFAKSTDFPCFRRGRVISKPHAI